MVDIQTPAEPTFAGCFSADGYTHDVQCVIYDGPDTDYTGREICVASNGGFGDDFDRYTIVDVTDKSSPVLITQMLYPTAGYAHQGWLTEDQRYFIANDELDETAFGIGTRTLVFDVSDLDEAEFLDIYTHPTSSSDHNLYIQGRYVYASNYTAGLRILDTEEIEGSGSDVLSTVAFFDTFPSSNQAGFQGTWSNYPFFESGIVIVNDITGGLFILEPQLSGSVSAEDEITVTESRLRAAYPNPFSRQTTLTLQVETAQQVTVHVYDSLGRQVETLFEGVLAADQAKVLVFDGSARPAGAIRRPRHRRGLRRDSARGAHPVGRANRNVCLCAAFTAWVALQLTPYAVPHMLYSGDAVSPISKLSPSGSLNGRSYAYSSALSRFFLPRPTHLCPAHCVR